ncbi:MAG: hypothetical protein U0531_14040 [Dehalococcoidia bacterium]
MQRSRSRLSIVVSAVSFALALALAGGGTHPSAAEAAGLPDLKASAPESLVMPEGGQRSLIAAATNVGTGAAVCPTAQCEMLRVDVPAGFAILRAQPSTGMTCTIVGNRVSCYKSKVAPAETVAVKIELKAPSASGVWGLHTSADPTNRIFESAEANNVAKTSMYVVSVV